jgi:hypothetical protein
MDTYVHIVFSWSRKYYIMYYLWEKPVKPEKRVKPVDLLLSKLLAGKWSGSSPAFGTQPSQPEK